MDGGTGVFLYLLPLLLLQLVEWCCYCKSTGRQRFIIRRFLIHTKEMQMDNRDKYFPEFGYPRILQIL